MSAGALPQNTLGELTVLPIPSTSKGREEGRERPLQIPEYATA